MNKPQASAVVADRDRVQPFAEEASALRWRHQSGYAVEDSCRLPNDGEPPRPNARRRIASTSNPARTQAG